MDKNTKKGLTNKQDYRIILPVAHFLSIADTPSAKRTLKGLVEVRYLYFSLISNNKEETYEGQCLHIILFIEDK